ncbi:MAG: hypothetical protein J07HQX50_00262 [Haloquadratum sp. J07HQX50]|nr:MAG: hypothetical protein J07HQX50_00262 [Haloquadratum sp. J07HQX50]
MPQLLEAALSEHTSHVNSVEASAGLISNTYLQGRETLTDTVLKYTEHEQHFLVILDEPVFEIIDVLRLVMLTIRESARVTRTSLSGFREHEANE